MVEIDLQIFVDAIERERGEAEDEAEDEAVASHVPAPQSAQVPFSP